MKQPNLGKKVAELRQQKAITQEHLAEICEVSTRTIQRIESGEVDPRSFTIQRLNDALEFDFGAGELANENLWLGILHLSSCFTIVLVPLLIWSFLKEKSYKLDRHGRDVLNFQITITILMFVAVACLILAPFLLIVRDINSPTPGANPAGFGVLEFLVIATVLPFIFIGIFVFYQGIKNTLLVMNGKPYYYPLSIQFLK
ncbi:MAG: DUF4870 domain-containing protein [Anaerolineales bacterium]